MQGSPSVHASREADRENTLIARHCEVFKPKTGRGGNGPPRPGIGRYRHRWNPFQRHPDPRHAILSTRSQTGVAPACGESYVDGWWDAVRVDEFIAKLLQATKAPRKRSRLADGYRLLLNALSNRQNRWRSLDNAQFHYDIGNDLYRAMLDREDDLYVRLLERRAGSGHGAGTQTRTRLPETPDPARNAGARHRLRLGELWRLCSRTARCPCHRRYGFGRSG